MTQLESLADALPRVAPVLILAVLWAAAVAWRHRENRRTWRDHDHSRGEGT